MVGLGLVSATHIKGYARHPGVRVTAVCDRDRPRAEEFAELHQIPEVYDAYEALLEGAQVDVISIATPTHLHAAMTLQAVRSGRHVHCEKPFCRFLAEGQLATEEAHRRSLSIAVGETYVFLSSFRKARELIEAGEIGRPLQLRQRHGSWLERSTSPPWPVPQDRGWRLNPSLSGGGDYPWLFDHSVHFFASAEYLMLDQQVHEVYAVSSQRSNTIEVEGAAHDPYTTSIIDVPILIWKYEDPELQGLWARAERLNGKYDHMKGFSASIFGESGMIEVLGEGGNNLLWEGEQVHLVLHRSGKRSLSFRFDEEKDAVWDSEISYYGQGHINQVQHFVDAVLNGTNPRYGAEDGLRSVRCTLAAIRSAREGRPVRVEEIGPEYKAYE